MASARVVKARGGLSQGSGRLRLRLRLRYSGWDAGTAVVKAGTGGTGHGCCRGKLFRASLGVRARLRQGC